MKRAGKDNGGQGVFRRQLLRQKRAAPLLSAVMIVTLFVFFAGAIGLASTTTVQELARGEAELVPTGRIWQVESFQGGVVRQVLVAEGQLVNKGDLLAVLGAPDLDRGADELRQALDSARAQRRDIDAISAAIAPASATPAMAAPSDNMATHSKTRLALHRARQDMLKLRAENLQATARSLESALTIIADRVRAKEKSVERILDLLENGHVTRARADGEIDALDELRSRQVDADIEHARTLDEYGAARSAALENGLTFREEIHAEGYQLDQEIAGLEIRMEGIKSQIGQLSIRAPEQGIIQAVEFPAPGEIVSAGATLFELLPTSATLVAEVRINPDDIGHVQVGDAVSLKLATFDARRYGQLQGVLKSLSPTFVADETGQEYFRATVSLNQDTIGQGKWQRQLQAGMTATAEIISDERTVIAYLLKPIQRSMDRAFTER